MSKLYYRASALMTGIILAVSCVFTADGNAQQKPDAYNTAVKEFRMPPAKYSTAPFWVWNYIVTKPMIDEQLKSIKEIGINQVIIHPRPGLVTEYLSAEWFDLIKYAVNTAKKLKMNVYLYDENSYPSGFGGGHVPSELPEVMNKFLVSVKTTKPDTVKDRFLVLKPEGDNFRPVTGNSFTKDVLYYVFYFERPERNPWYAGFTYVDLLQKKTTSKFLQTTHEKYKNAIGGEFGKSVLGMFTDEPYPEFRQIPYTLSIFEEFQKKYGYDLKLNLPSLIEETGNYRKVRHDTYKLLLELFVDAWAKPYSEWCEKNNLAFTGHYWEHSWGELSFGPDDMALTSYSHIPGVDVLFNKFNNRLNDQFGNDMMVKEIKSVANQMGRERFISETYGASGWDLNFKDMKRIGDWEYALGVNLMNQHLMWGSITGYRKFDHPPTFSYHAPYFKDYKVLADYYSRLSSALSKGIQNNKILLLEPTTSNWMYWRSSSTHADKIMVDSIRMACINSFHKITHDFESSQVEYDIGSEYLIEKYGKVDGNYFKINKGSYSLFIIPQGTSNLELKTFELLKSYLQNGGKVLSTKELPEYIDGAKTEKISELVKSYKENWITVENMTAQDVKMLSDQPLTFNIESGSDKLYHMRKELDKAQLLFLANIDESAISKGSFEIKGGSVEVWDLFSGNIKPYPCRNKNSNIEVKFNMEPGASLLLCIKNETAKPIDEINYSLSKIELNDKPKIERLSPNTLIIDFCDLRLKGETFKDMYFFDAQKKIFNAYGMPSNSWMGIQFKHLVMDRNKFDANSGFEADYKFTIDERTDLSDLQAVYERPEIYKLKINGVLVSPVKGKWFIDKDFAVYNISKYVKTGVNIVTVISNPMSVLSELDRLIIRGNFNLQPQELGFKLTPSTVLEIGDWTKQGMQLYSDRVSYEHTINISGKESYIVKLPEWKGSCAEVYVNNTYAGIIAFNPFEMDITKYLKSGSNKIKVVVVSTLRNLYGPHHTKKAFGETWPAHFFSVKSDEGCTLAGDSYFIYPYGLMKDFEVYKKK